VGILDLMDALNWVDRVEGLISSFVHADWKGASRKRGRGGIAGELGRALTGGSSWSFHIPRASGWSGADIERFLSHYGIVIWGRRVTSEHFIFSVKERQANWAEYLLLRRGLPVSGRSYNPLNPVYGQRYAPGDQPPAWADRQRR
jgi:hypothetical protein